MKMSIRRALGILAILIVILSFCLTTCCPTGSNEYWRLQNEMARADEYWELEMTLGWEVRRNLSPQEVEKFYAGNNQLIMKQTLLLAKTFDEVEEIISDLSYDSSPSATLLKKRLIGKLGLQKNVDKDIELYWDCGYWYSWNDPVIPFLGQQKKFARFEIAEAYYQEAIELATTADNYVELFFCKCDLKFLGKAKELVKSNDKDTLMRIKDADEYWQSILKLIKSRK